MSSGCPSVSFLQNLGQSLSPRQLQREHFRLFNHCSQLLWLGIRSAHSTANIIIVIIIIKKAKNNNNNNNNIGLHICKSQWVVTSEAMISQPEAEISCLCCFMGTTDPYIYSDLFFASDALTHHILYGICSSCSKTFCWHTENIGPY